MAQIDTFRKKAFADFVRLRYQEFGKLQGFFQRETITGNKQFFDFYDSSDMQERTQRASEYNYTEMPRKRRVISPRKFVHPELFDEDDDIRLMSALVPDSSYARGLEASMGRQVDDLIIEAFGATAYEGEDGTTAATLPAAHDISQAALDTDIIRTAQNLLDDDDVPMEGRVAVAPMDAKEDLLADTEVINADFNTIRTLVGGTVDTWMGFTWIFTTRITAHASGKKYVYFAHRDAMVLGMARDPVIKIDVIPERDHATQVVAKVTGAATRVQDNGVVRLEIDVV